MWSKCNQCITQKCLSYYADNCEDKLNKQIEEDEIVPPCRQKPNSPCQNRQKNTPTTSRVSGSMQIIVNGKPVSNMDDALEHIKQEMAKTVTPPCEPGTQGWYSLTRLDPRTFLVASHKSDSLLNKSSFYLTVHLLVFQSFLSDLTLEKKTN